MKAIQIRSSYILHLLKIVLDVQWRGRLLGTIGQLTGDSGENSLVLLSVRSIVLDLLLYSAFCLFPSDCPSVLASGLCSSLVHEYIKGVRAPCQVTLCNNS